MKLLKTTRHTTDDKLYTNFDNVLVGLFLGIDCKPYFTLVIYTLP